MAEAMIVEVWDGRQLALCQWGPPGGRPIILCHGTPGSRRFHHPNGEYERVGLRVAVYDWAGYGASSRIPGSRMIDSAAHIAAVADSLGYDCFAVAGISGGAGHALAAAAKLPDRVTRCGLIVPLGPFGVCGLDFFQGMTAAEQAHWTRIVTDGADHVIASEYPG